ncbi:MAG: hypothetical protein ACKV0T_03830 [Planctomycetales bacterium]
MTARVSLSLQQFQIRPLVTLLVSLAAITLAGCGPGQASPKGSTEDVTKVLSVALDAWKAGKKPDELRSEKPAVNIADQDWQAGLALKEYQVSGSPVKYGGNWRVSAVLTLTDERQSALQKQVAYDVTIQPAITILRADDVPEE